MQPPSQPAAAGRPQLHSALLEYQRHPGKYTLARREPAVLFASIRAILQLAAGKSGDHGEIALQPAACSFLRSALIYPGADHYTLLGVTRLSDAATIKEHYRLMMRLVHPDFSAASVSVWPPDSATRLNLAYEVLASSERRARYDEELAAGAAPPPQPQPQPRPQPLARNALSTSPKKLEIEPRQLVKRLAAGFGVAGVLGVAALVIAGGGDLESLSQKPAPLAAALPGASSQSPPAKPRPGTPATDTASLPPPTRMLPALAAEAPAQTSTAGLEEAAPMEHPQRTAHRTPQDVPPVPPAVRAATPPVLVPTYVPPAAPTATAAPAPSTVTTNAIAKPNAGVTLAEAQPLLAALLQQIESGRADRLLNLLDGEARSGPAAQALSRQLDGLLDGAGRVKLSNVQFRAQPAEGRLLVIGHVMLHTGDAGVRAGEKKLSLRVEFMSRDGAVVMTGLSGLAGN